MTRNAAETEEDDMTTGERIAGRLVDIERAGIVLEPGEEGEIRRIFERSAAAYAEHVRISHEYGPHIYGFSFTLDRETLGDGPIHG